MNPYKVVQDFEKAVSDYTFAPFVVAVNSGSNALLLAVKWWADGSHFDIQIPRHTYVSVPQSIYHAGCTPIFRDENWTGSYQLKPSPVWDSARRFTSGMYRPGQFQCVSFSSSKILGIEQGGAILHDNQEADIWFRKMRFDGRTEGVDPLEDNFDVCGYHCFMPPGIAAQLLLKLNFLPKHNQDLPYYEYPDLSKFSKIWE